jgi:UDP-N-acetylglucosamine 4,6-dehydratase
MIMRHTVGVRPGEKLHETMIPADDAYATLELDDRYVILQGFAGDSRDAYLRRGGRPVADGFSYSSDSNPEQLDARGLQNLLQLAHA